MMAKTKIADCPRAIKSYPLSKIVPYLAVSCYVFKIITNAKERASSLSVRDTQAQSIAGRWGAVYENRLCRIVDTLFAPPLTNTFTPQRIALC